jgi:hypothetical protein
MIPPTSGMRTKAAPKLEEAEEDEF